MDTALNCAALDEFGAPHWSSGCGQHRVDTALRSVVWPTSKWPSLGGPLSEFGTLQLELRLWPTSNGYSTAELWIVVNIKVAFFWGGTVPSSELSNMELWLWPT
jgi:hypothetical protein